MHVYVHHTRYKNIHTVKVGPWYIGLEGNGGVKRNETRYWRYNILIFSTSVEKNIANIVFIVSPIPFSLPFHNRIYQGFLPLQLNSSPLSLIL